MNASDPMPNLTLEGANQMDDFSLCDHLWELVTSAFYDQNPDGGEGGPPIQYPESIFATKLSIHWKVAYAIHAFEYDVLAGGLHGFFFNHQGILNQDLLVSFKTIGATEYMSPFQAAAEVSDTVVETLHNPDWEHTDEEYDREDSRLSAALGDANRQFSDLMRVKSPRDYLSVFLRENIQLFTKPS